jgi:hypothetical protein
VDGFTGTYTKTIVGADITDFSTSFEGNYNNVHVSIPGADGEQMDENNSADYPDGAVGIWNFNGNSNDLLGLNNGTDTNVTYGDDGAEFNGIDSIISIPIININTTASSIFIKFKYNTIRPSYLLSDNYQYYRYLGVIDNDGYFIAEAGVNSEYVQFTDSPPYNVDTEKHSAAIVFENGTTAKSYLDGTLVNTANSAFTSFDISRIGGMSPSFIIDGVIYEASFYNKSLQSNNIVKLHTGINGTAARTLPNGTWVPVIDGEADLPVDPSGNVTAIEVMTSSGIETSDVGITGSWTEDVTIIEESEDEDHVYVYANITTSQNATSGSWEYDVASLNFTYNMSINSDNSNVTGTYHNGTVTLDTGLLNFGDSFNYTLTFDKLTSFTFWANWISKTSTKAVVEYNSTNSNVENDFYLENMSASSTFDFKYSNGTILVNATSDSNGYLKFDDVGGVTDSYKLINDTYTIEKQAEKFPVSTFIISSFVAVVAGFFGLRFGNQRRKR